MTRSCTTCGTPYEITPDDLAFYAKISPVFNGKRYDIPPPTLCPQCRQQRRYAWRNERSLYHRKCALTGKSMITNYGPHTNIVAYEHHAWHGDQWDAKKYGREFDFGKPFFAQFHELQKVVPQLGLCVWNSENADYCNYVGHVKNSYIIFGSVYSEDCYYGSPYYSKNCVDTLVLRNCEWCYECTDCRELTMGFYCQDCHSSHDLLFCYDCQGCAECIGCAGLRRKQYCIFNEQQTKEEYFRKKKELDLCHPDVRKYLENTLEQLLLKIPHRLMQGKQTQNVTGNYIYNAKNTFDSYFADNCEDCRHCMQVVDLKDCRDNNYTEENELCYEYLGAYQNSRLAFSKFCNKLHDSLYCDACHHSSHLFGCIGVRNSEYCILNKQYTKEEYERLVPKMIDHMRQTKEYGEFFPIEDSPFGYNETVAQEYFPLTKEEIQKRWPASRSRSGGWYEEEKKEEMYMGPEEDIPGNIDDVNDDVCGKILRCEKTGKLFKIIPQELAFYRRFHLPIPKFCPDERHRRRIAKRNPRTLYDRTCGKCGKAIQTTYAPDRPEFVYCEDCYLKTVY